MSLLEFVNLTYTYDGQQPLLRGASGQLEQGRLYAILGPSGCGKTTLLSLLGGLDSPQGGHILFQGKNIAETGLGQHRRRHVAFVFQSYNLIDYLTPAENVALASKLPPLPLLERLGLTKEEARRSVLRLSGGQQQRVAIARALASAQSQGEDFVGQKEKSSLTWFSLASPSHIFSTILHPVFQISQRETYSLFYAAQLLRGGYPFFWGKQKAGISSSLCIKIQSFPTVL